MKTPGMRSIIIVFVLAALALLACAIRGYSADEPQKAQKADWEYVSREINFKNGRYEFASRMNELGADGWEIFHVESIDYGGVAGYTLFGKRLKK